MPSTTARPRNPPMHSSTASRPRFAWATRALPRGTRRALVLAVYAGFAAFMAVMYLGVPAGPRCRAQLALAAIVRFAATTVAFVRLVTAPGYAADVLDPRLDERQRQVRDHAYRLAYYGLTVLVGVFALAVMYAA